MMNCAGCRLVVGCTSTNCCRLRFCCWSCWSCCRSYNIRETAWAADAERTHLGRRLPGEAAPPTHANRRAAAVQPTKWARPWGPARSVFVRVRWVVTYAEPDFQQLFKVPTEQMVRVVCFNM